MGFTKAKIKVEREKGTETIDVLFNPAEYNLTDSANYSERKVVGVDGPINQYISGEQTVLTMTLMLDTYDNTSASIGGVSLGNTKPTDVSKETKKLSDLTAIDGSQHRPPICKFIWGSLSFRGYVSKCEQTFTMFTESGMPVRAKVNLTFNSVTDVTATKKASPFESPDRTKYRTLKEGTQLWNLAYEEYGDPGLWRVIADANGIMNPLDIYPGQQIKLPAL